MATAWLRCKVRPGIFSHERIVTIEIPNRGEPQSMFVYEDLVRADDQPVRGHDVDGLLRVHASVDDTQRVTVILPDVTVDWGRYCHVSNRSLFIGLK